MSLIVRKVGMSTLYGYVVPENINILPPKKEFLI